MPFCCRLFIKFATESPAQYILCSAHLLRSSHITGGATGTGAPSHQTGPCPVQCDARWWWWWWWWYHSATGTPSHHGPCPVFVTLHVDAPDTRLMRLSADLEQLYILWTRQGQHQTGSSGGQSANQMAHRGNTDQSEVGYIRINSSDDHQTRNKHYEKEVRYLKMNWTVVLSKQGLGFACTSLLFPNWVYGSNIALSEHYEVCCLLFRRGWRIYTRISGPWPLCLIKWSHVFKLHAWSTIMDECVYV